MKTIKTLLIFAAIFGLQIHHLFAEGAISSAASSASLFPGTINIAALAPVTPGVATFEEAGEIFTSALNPEQFSPRVPLIADFVDDLSGNEIPVANLVPVIPAEADFEDSTSVMPRQPSELAPGTPVLADFSENI